MMSFAELRIYCLNKRGATEDFPFDADTAVFRVMNKMFALMSVTADPPRINLKCDPNEAELLRQHPAITAGYHMDKRHWNTVMVDGSLPDEEVCAMIDDSYTLVVKGLTRKERETLNQVQD